MKALFYATVLFLCSNTYAQQVTILTEHLPPFQLVEKGKVGGFATQIVEAVFENAAVDYELSNHQWSDAYQYTLKTPNTCLYSTTRTQEREPLFAWVGKITNLTTALFAKAGSNISLDNLEDAKQYTVAVMKEDFYHQQLTDLGFEENKNLYVNSSYSALSSLLELPTRQIDLVIANAHHMPYRLSKTQTVDDVELVLDVKELQSELYLACNRDTNQNIIDTLKTSMTALANTGTLQKIEDNWFKHSHQKS